MTILKTRRVGARHFRSEFQANKRYLRFEPLESRTLLSATLPGGPQPLPAESNSGPVGLPTPTQVIVSPNSVPVVSPDQLVSYDVASHTETVLPYNPAGTGSQGSSAPQQGSVPSQGPEKSPNLQLSDAAGSSPNFIFGTDTRQPVGESSVTTFPWSTVGRIWYEYPDGTQWSSSAAVVGPRTLLTAGHVVYNAAHGGYPTYFFFSPGQDGNKIFDPVSGNTFFRSDFQPYGAAQATGFETYTAWTASQDYDYDIGYVTLDRDIGDYTGWMGYGWNSNNSFFQGLGLNTAGYPGDLDVSTDTMYTAFGTIQTVNTNNLQSTSIPLGPGQDGSPLWTYNGNNADNVIYATMSSEWTLNGNPDYNQFTRITQSEFTDLSNLITADGTTTDLPCLVDTNSWFNTDKASFSPSSISPGGPFTAESWVTNIGTGAASNFQITYYADTATTLTGGTLYPLGTFDASGLNAMSSGYATLPGNLPLNVPAGTYHLAWVISTTQSESFSGGTQSGVSLAATFTVPQPVAGSISGTVYDDVNGDGQYDAGDTPLAGWTVYLDLNNDGKLDPGDPSKTSSSTGAYSFTGLAAGTYTVREVNQTGWTETQPTIATLTVGPESSSPAIHLATAVTPLGALGSSSPAATAAVSSPADASTAGTNQPILELVKSSDGSVPTSTTPVGYTPSQIQTAYGFNRVQIGSITGNGAGETIAIVDAYDSPTIASDLQAFDLAYGLPNPPSFTRVAQDGSTNYPPTDPAGKGNPKGNWEMETALDVEWAHALAPGANILLVEATSSSNADLIETAVPYASKQAGVVVVSMSFGESEQTGDLQLNSIFTTPSGHTPVTYVASTGDDGAPGGYPAYSPNVLAVGGTSLSTDSSGDYLGETAWSGSGGGISTVEAQPSYQAGVVTQSSTARTIPDVAFDADPNTGVGIYDTYDFPSSPWVQIGGTSLSAPCWSALIAIADQSRAAAGESSLDGPSQTLPDLYSLPAGDFHDITTGGNGTYNAGPGYDLVTGRGTPVANDIVSGLTSGSGTGGYYTVTITASNPNFTGLNFGNEITNQPPATPSNTSPANGATGVSLTPALQASAYSDPNGKSQIGSQFDVYSDAQLTHLVWSDTITAAPFNSATIPAGTLSASTPYYWDVRYENADPLWSLWSTATSFTTQTVNQPPATPSNTAPTNGATGVSLTPTLQASAYSDPNGMTQIGSQFDVYSDAQLTHLVWSDTITAAPFNSATVPAGTLSASTPYYWNVRYENADPLWSSWSTATSFTTTAPTTKIEVDLIAVTAPNASDTSASLPTSASSIVTGSEFYVEVWTKDVDGSANGITGGDLDFSFNTANIRGGAINHGGIYTTLTGGTVSNTTGMVTDLSGNVSPGNNSEGVSQWVRLGYVPLQATSQGTAAFTASPGTDEFARANDGAIPWTSVQLNKTPLSVAITGSIYDLDNNGLIGNGDYGLFSTDWHATPTSANWNGGRSDFDHSGLVGNGDYSWFSANWHKLDTDPTMTYPNLFPNATYNRLVPPGTLSSRIQVELVPVASATSSDTAASLPTALLQEPVGGTFYVEVWAKDLAGSANGITGGDLNFSFDTSKLSGGPINHGGIYTNLTGGTVNKTRGTVTDLSGDVKPGDNSEGVGQWVLLGYVPFTATTPGTAAFTATAGSDQFAQANVGGIAWSNVELNQVRASVKIVQGSKLKPPAASLTAASVTAAGGTPVKSGSLSENSSASDYLFGALGAGQGGTPAAAPATWLGSAIGPDRDAAILLMLTAGR